MALSRILCLSPAQLKPPYHLRHEDLEYAMIPIDIASHGVIVGRREGKETKREEAYVDVRDEKEGGEEGIAFVRVLRNPVTEEYFVSMCYSPWPAYTPDPYHRLAFMVEEGRTLMEALRGVHRLFPYYTHDRAYPLPFHGTWVDYRLMAEVMEAIEQEALSQGIGARRGAVAV